MDIATIKTLVETLGPSGAILAIGFVAVRGVFKEVWPWLRDQYLARMISALEKLAASGERIEARLAGVESSVTSLQENVQDVQQDQAALFGLLRAEQPSRPRSLARGVK